MIKDKKAIALFSGGLDSILSVKYMVSLGYGVFPVFFQTPYLLPDKALNSAQQNGLQLIVKDISDQHFELLKKPRYGFGRNYNPCIDCHALMFKIAGGMLQELGADFLISGEVLGQRPKSQVRDAINAVSKASEFADLLIRPLSQKLLNPTLPIREGWVLEEEMLDFHGRGRSRQQHLAKELGIVNYPQPGGGCLLTDVNFSLRLSDFFHHSPEDRYQLELLNFGRHFRLNDTTRLIVGRDENDNKQIEARYKHGIIFLTRDFMGPLGLLISDDYPPELIRQAASIFLYYNKKAPSKAIVKYGQRFCLDFSIECEKAVFDTVSSSIICLERDFRFRENDVNKEKP